MPGLRKQKETNQVVEAKGFGVWDFKKQQKVDIRGTSNEPYFNGKDVCAILGYADPKKALQEHLDEDEK